MANLNLTGQNQQANQIRPRIGQLKQRLDQRKVVWDKIPGNKKKNWTEAVDDQIMVLAWETYVYLKDYFKDREGENA